MAPKYWPIVNLLVYSAIWLRASVYVSLSALQNLIPQRKLGDVFEHNLAQAAPPAEDTLELIER